MFNVDGVCGGENSKMFPHIDLYTYHVCTHLFVGYPIIKDNINNSSNNNSNKNNIDQEKIKNNKYRQQIEHAILR